MTTIDRTEQKLGFDRIRSMTEALCSTDSAKKMVQSAPFSYSIEDVTEMLSLADEMRIITMLESGFPDSGYVDTTASLVQLEHDSYYLDIQAISRLRVSLETLRQILAFFKSSKDGSYPYLRKLTEPILLFPEVTRRIDALLDRFGEIKDSASEELQAIRRSIKDKESTISKRITTLLKKGQQEGIIEIDSSVTVRDGRMLLPVSAANKRKIPGFVVDESATGKTLYIEPIEIVELNNMVKELQFAEQREILRILIAFSDFLRPYRDDLLISSELLAKIDFIWAKARLGISMGAGKPIVSNDREINLKNARHPLLEKALKREGKEIVPLTLSLNRDKHILLISGPNAGGKSVCLKSVGLLQYMLQCGFLIPASESSELTLFDKIFIDIGDEQSIENDLSTYSSHLNNMRAILEEATQNSLVLIDEFGAGTEPTAGGAIAEAILNEIEKRGCFGVITTHYGNLKLYASGSRGVINGGMQFDVQNIKPLFKLETGVPGSSFAFELARKIGLSEDVVKKAEERAGTDFVDMERHLKKIAKNRRAWEERLAKIKSTDKTLENITDKYQKELTEIQLIRKKIVEQAREEAANLINEANRKIEATIREIRESQAEREKTREARRGLIDFSKEIEKLSTDSTDDKIAAKMDQLLKRKERREERKRDREVSSTKVSANTPVIKEDNLPLKSGDKVRVKGGDLIGEILKIEGSNVSVAIGSVISKLSKDKIERISNKEYNGIVKSSSSRVFSVRESEDITQRKLNFKPSIDIRGERLEQAIDSVTRFVDDAVMVGVAEIKILHGKGNGILREELRKYLKTMGGVASFRDEHLQMGGSGITVVTLDN
ncbi:MAG: endonuclease MutS2 [Bacteroidetes bacterium HGW-Bacteroidetes-8]|jgi:DNA mismatch repair protein MutS2|nr:MAG: endonuclease MutS2 [Bacteroidetes bacterium HGW-Bacteroidetes-8]